jgi:hypothetical protein
MSHFYAWKKTKKGKDKRANSMKTEVEKVIITML